MNKPLIVVTDAHNCHAMTEELLDEWFRSLAPAEKADLYALFMEKPGTLAEMLCDGDPYFTACGVRDPETFAALVQVGEAALASMRAISGRELAR